MVSELLLRLF